MTQICSKKTQTDFKRMKTRKPLEFNKRSICLGKRRVPTDFRRFDLHAQVKCLMAAVTLRFFDKEVGILAENFYYATK